MTLNNHKNDRTPADALADYLSDWVLAGVDRIPRLDEAAVERILKPYLPENPEQSVPEPVIPEPAEPIEPEQSAGKPMPEISPREEPILAEVPSKAVIETESSESSMEYKIDQITAQINPKSGKQVRAESLLQLAEIVAGCKNCPDLVSNRTNTVFGSGNPSAELVFIGEGPGADEDRQGLPFVGRSGQLLTDIIVKGMKMTREEVYICNIVRCRPPGNRNPSPMEAALCRPFLDATLKVIQPKYICCLGSISAHSLLDTDEPIGRMRGRVFEYGSAKVVCTYHPAYLLRNPPAKVQTWEDIKLLLRTMGRME